METTAKEHVVRNCLTYAYDALRSKDRLMGETTESYYENYFHQLLESLGPPGKRWETTVPNSEVESFYLGNTSLGEFRLHTQKRVFSKVPVWEFAPLSSVIWSIACSAPDRTSLCSKLDTGLSRQIWEIFISLDVDSQGKLHIDDLCDLIQRIFRENGHVESEQNIKEWFCEEKLIDFWSFFAAIVENYSGLLKPNIIRSLHELVFCETLLCGKLTKKGHKIHSWKERWFTLQPTLLSYYESFENMILKGMIAIGADTQFEFMADCKSHQRRFKIIDHTNQVPYEICTPDVAALQKWNYGIQVAVEMNKVNGSNFLHKLTLAQKHVFPENTTFAISAVTHTKLTTPFGLHPPLSPSRSVPIAQQPPLPYSKHKIVAEMRHQSSLTTETGTPNGDDTDGPPPIPQQRFDAASVTETPPKIPQRKSSTGSSVVVVRERMIVREKPKDSASFGIREAKSRRRHSSINYSSEFEREQEKERERLEHINVGGAMYAVVNKQNSKNGAPELPEKEPAREIRRIRPKTPSPSAERRGYIQLQFQNGGSMLSPAPAVPKRDVLPPDSRTKWSYSTVVFESELGQKEKEKEFENDFGANKKNKPLPPTPASFKSSTSDPNILAPQPAPRGPKKTPHSLVDITQPNDQRGGRFNYRAIDFSAQSPVQNGNVVGTGKAKKEKPRLPPKEDSPKLPPKDEKPRLPPKEDSPKLPPKHEKPRLPPKQESMEKRKLPPKEDTSVVNTSQSLPPSRPVPAPRRIVSPSSEVPPPIPARRSPLPPP